MTILFLLIIWVFLFPVINQMVIEWYEKRERKKEFKNNK